MIDNYSQIIYIYFVYEGNKLIYIGRSKNPLNRINNHRLSGVIGRENYKMVVYGPYEKWHGYYIESYEIIKRARNKYLKSQTNNNYGYSEKFSVKDSGQKIIYFFEGRSQVKKVVC